LIVTGNPNRCGYRFQECLDLLSAQPLAGLALPQLRLGLLTVRDVDEGSNNATLLALLLP
jgi:hypothetical protein